MNVNKFTLYSYLSIRDKLLLPLDKFLSNEEIVSICKNSKFNNKFFPLPFFLPANDNDIKNINEDKISIRYEKIIYGSVKIKSISTLNKNLILDLLFRKKAEKINHPFKDYLLNCGDYVVETEKFIYDYKKKK